MANDFEPPPPLKSGLGYQLLNERFSWLQERIFRPGDDSVDTVNGVGGKPGLIFAKGNGGAAANYNKCWSLYATPYTGSGSPPDDYALNVSIRSGQVDDGRGGQFPARRNITIAIPPNNTDGYCIWLAVIGDADGFIQSCDWAHGPNTPGQTTITSDEKGSLPAPTYYLTHIVTSTAHAADIAGATYCVLPGFNLSLQPNLTGVSANIERRPQWSPGSKNPTGVT